MTSIDVPAETFEALERIQEASFARASSATAGAFPATRRMTGEALATFLRRRAYGVLATVRPDGRPHAAPVGYALVGTRFVIASLAGAARVRNITHEPHASLVIEEGDHDVHGAVIVEGTARIVHAADAPLDMKAPFREPSGALKSWIEVFVVLGPERLLSYASPGFSPAG